MSSEITLSPAAERLSAQERSEYESYLKSGKPGLAVVLASRLYELWLNGSSIDELVSLNKGLSRGAILRARVEGRWDERREAYLAELMANAQDRVKLIALESVNFMGLLLAVANKQHGEKLKAYLQSGNPADLGGFDIQTIRQYKEVIEMLTKITGQDKKGAPAAGQSVTVQVSPDGAGGITATASTKWSAEEGDAIRAILEKRAKAND